MTDSAEVLFAPSKLSDAAALVCLKVEYDAIEPARRRLEPRTGDEERDIECYLHTFTRDSRSLGGERGSCATHNGYVDYQGRWLFMRKV